MKSNATTMTRQDAIPHVSYVVDDAGSGRPLNDDMHAIVRESGQPCPAHADGPEYGSVLIGWNCFNGPMFVAVHSYLDVELTDGEAYELARDYLLDIEWFDADGHHEDDLIADYMIR